MSFYTVIVIRGTIRRQSSVKYFRGCLSDVPYLLAIPKLDFISSAILDLYCVIMNTWCLANVHIIDVHELNYDLKRK